MALRSTKDKHHDKGVSLARFPALVIGSLLLAAGLLLLLKNGVTENGGFPDGTAQGTNFLGFETNGWTAFFTILAGGLVLFGAAQHLLAKTMSLLVGLAIGACSVIALVDGDDVLGLAAANGPTKLGWGIASIALLINALLPRKGGTDKADHDTHRDVVAPPPRREKLPVQETTGTRTVVEEPVTRRTTEPARTTTHETADVRRTDGGSVSEDEVRRR